MLNLSASPFDYTHNEDRKAVIKSNVLKYKLPMFYCNTVGSQTEIVFDGTSLAFDKQGNLWASGPGGILILSPQGKHLGTLNTGEATANCAFGDRDGSMLYITADMYLCRVQTLTQGTGF